MRRVRPESWLVAASMAFAILLPPAAAQAQTPGVTLSGLVVEGSTAVEGATVELRGVAERVTDERGGFTFGGIQPSTYTIRVRAIGYRTYERSIQLRADTTIVVALDVDPVVLDSIRADARFVDLRGRVTDRATGRAVIDASVYHDEDHEAFTNLGGYFRMRRMPEGYPVVVEVSALGYQPVRLTVVPEEEREIEVALDVDSIGLRMIERQVERLDQRVKPIAVSLRSVDREALLRFPASTAEDVVRRNIPGRAIQCLVVDEMAFGAETFDRRTGRGDLRDVLSAFQAEELERIEILGGGAMVRVYTRRFIQLLIRGRRTIRPITWGFGGCH